MSKYLNNWEWEPEEVLVNALIVPPHQLSLFNPAEWGGNDDPDLSTCPYYQRYHALPGCDPSGVCYQQSVCDRTGEPLCVTDEPKDGWPSNVSKGQRL